MGRTWQLSSSAVNYREGDQLGEGAFGTVYKGILHGTTTVAVKVLKEKYAGGQHTQDLIKECNLLRTLMHNRIVQFIGACLEQNRQFMVTEYMLGGSLGDLLETNPHHAAWNRYGKQILLDVAEALNYLHSREPRVLHSDLKPDNVLLTEHMRAKIGDVGVSKASDKTLRTLIGCSRWYAAPEALISDHVTTKADIFSYGIMVWQICSGCSDTSQYESLAAKRTGQRCPSRLSPIEMPRDAPELAVKIFDMCTQCDPDCRPLARDIFNMLKGNSSSSEQSSKEVCGVKSLETEEEIEEEEYNEYELSPDYLRDFDISDRIWYLCSDGYWLKGRVVDMNKDRIKIWATDRKIRRFSPEEYTEITECIRERERTGEYSVPFSPNDEISYRRSDDHWISCEIDEITEERFTFTEKKSGQRRFINVDSFDSCRDRFKMDKKFLVEVSRLERLLKF